MDINISNATHPSMPNRPELEAETKSRAGLNQPQSENVQQANQLASTQVVDKLKKAEEADAKSEKEEEVEKQALESVVEELSDVMKLMNKDLAFSVDEDSGTAVVKVMDIDSGELIRQIPSDEALELAQKLQDVKGLLMRTEA